MSFVEPASYDLPTYRQEINFVVSVFDPQPTEKNRKTYAYGHRVVEVSWVKPTRPISASIRLTAVNQVKLRN
ncbi:MAG: hypothetical protein U5J82_06565 [Desulfobacterales bacterium]|nr:hypothetical protein [Desulfobacterales bacterium]